MGAITRNGEAAVGAMSGAEPEASRPGRWRRVTLILALLAALVCAPAAAYAAFTSAATARMPVSTLVLSAPDTSTTTATTTCATANGKYHATLKVTQFGPIPRGNAYRLIVTDPTGVRTWAKVTPAGGSITVTLSSAAQVSTQWTYELRGYYEVPNTDNVWTGPPAGPFPAPMPSSCSGQDQRPSWWGQDQPPSWWRQDQPWWGQDQPWRGQDQPWRGQDQPPRGP
jgi:hypothetical protein